MRLSSHIQDRLLRVCVLGLGHIGLPLTCRLLQKKFQVLGYDLDEQKILALKRAESYLPHIDQTILQEALLNPLLQLSSNLEDTRSCQIFILCVPTPLDLHRQPDMQAIHQAASDVSKVLKKDDLIILASTTYPGTTEALLAPLLSTHSGLQAGKDFFLAYSPEREDPGGGHDMAKIPKIVAGYSSHCLELAKTLYEILHEKVFSASSCRSAEMSKLLENIFRSVNIALVNELKILCHGMDLDIWEIIHLAATKPFGFMPFYPGPGLGGHCIPIDPFYLTWIAQSYGQKTKFVELAGDINRFMPNYVVQRLMEALNKQGKALSRCRILLLGLAYKPGIADTRDSPSVKLLELLQGMQTAVHYHDPYVPSIILEDLQHQSRTLYSKEISDPDVLQSYDAAILMTQHPSFSIEYLLAHSQLFVDTRGCTKPWHSKIDFRDNQKYCLIVDA